MKNAGIKEKIIVSLFLIKVADGLLNGFFALHYSSYNPDTAGFHFEGLNEYHLLFNHPKEYFFDLFRSGYTSGYSGLLQTHQSYWNDLEYALIIKLLSVFDIFSFGNYYINVIFYNFITFFGIVGLFRVFANIYPTKTHTLIISCFLLPSLLFFSSITEKEGLMFSMIGIVVFNIYYALNYSGFRLIRILYISLALFFIFLLRAYVLIAVLPALFAWVVAHYSKRPSLLMFSIIYIFGLIVFFNFNKIFPTINFPEIVTQRRIDFESLGKPNSYLAVDTLYPTAKSFAHNAPQALSHILWRPYFSEFKISLLIIPFAIEIFLYELLLLIFIFYHYPFQHKTNCCNPFILFCLFFSISVFLIIGYTVPIIGAFVRYRAIYLPFLMTPLLCNIDWAGFSKGLRFQK